MQQKITEIKKQFPDLKSFLEISLHNKAKRLALRLDTKKRIVRFTIPKTASSQKAVAFLRANESWIIDKIDNLPDPVIFEDGVNFPWLGQTHKLIVHYDCNRKRTDIHVEENHIIHVHTNKTDAQTRIIRFLKKQAEDYFLQLAIQKSKMIHKTINKLTVRDTKSRWGSCSADGSISLSWRLGFAPYEAMDYVIAHEVAHLKHLDHSAKFWALCRDLSIDFKTGKNWMFEHGHSLMRFGAAPTDNQEPLEE